MPSLSFDIDILDSTRINIEKGLERGVLEGLDNIRSNWGILMVMEQVRLQETWRPLTSRYLARKVREQRQGKIRHIDKLRRTGSMMVLYIRGIAVNQTEAEVSIPFPTDYAAIHQSYDYEYYRRFELDPFIDEAIETMKESLTKYV